MKKTAKTAQKVYKCLFLWIMSSLTVSTNGYTQQKIGYVLFVSQSEIYVSETKEV